jgi:hypothetical protein
LFNVIVYSCISSKGYNAEGVCLFNENANACKCGTLTSGFGMIAALLYLGAEYIFQTTSSIKMRRYSVRSSLVLSTAFAGLGLLCFAFLSISWSKAAYPLFGFGINSGRTAIAFSLFSVIVWAASAWLAYQRFLLGVDPGAFASMYEQAPTADANQAGQIGGYTAYASGTAAQPQYSEQGMYSTQNMQDVNFASTNFQQPSY